MKKSRSLGEGSVLESSGLLHKDYLIEKISCAYSTHSGIITDGVEGCKPATDCHHFGKEV
jgi:hypothetical protein